MHAAQALALLEVADRVQVVARGAVQQRAALVAARRAGVGEDAVQVEHPRVDQERVAPLQRDPRLGQAEGVAQHQVGGLQRVAAARHVLQRVAAAQLVAGADDRHVALGQAGHPLDDHRARRQRTLVRAHLEQHLDPAALDQLAVAGAPAHRHRPRHEAHPQPGRSRQQHQAQRRCEQLAGAEPPGNDVQPRSEGQRSLAAAGQHLDGHRRAVDGLTDHVGRRRGRRCAHPPPGSPGATGRPPRPP